MALEVKMVTDKKLLRGKGRKKNKALTLINFACLVSFRILVTFVAYCRLLKYNNKKKIDYGKNDKRNGSAGLSHP